MHRDNYRKRPSITHDGDEYEDSLDLPMHGRTGSSNSPDHQPRSPKGTCLFIMRWLSKYARRHMFFRPCTFVLRLVRRKNVTTKKCVGQLKSLESWKPLYFPCLNHRRYVQQPMLYFFSQSCIEN